MNYERVLCERVRKVPPSGIRRFFDIVSEMKDVISLGVGEPDFTTPWRCSDAAIYSLRTGHTHYTSNRGLKELTRLISEYEARFGVRYDPATEVMVTVGASEGIDLALRALIDDAQPLVQYGIDRRIERHDLSRPEGRSAALADALSVLAPIKDSLLAKDYARQIAGRVRAREEDALEALARIRDASVALDVPVCVGLPLALEGGGECSIRLIDCVGYMVEGAMGHEENDKPRMVKSPWFDEEIPFDLAAETGTRKVIRDHSTIGIVVTTDGTISEIPRENYIPAEKRVIDELEALGKPFVILLNSTHPDAPETRAMAAEMEESYGRTVLPVSCLDLDEAQLGEILQKVLYEFPVRELDFALPRWVTMLDKGHWLQTEVYTAAMQLSEKISRMKDVSDSGRAALDCEAVENAALSGMNLADGVVRITVLLKPEVFYKVLSEQTGLEIGDEAGLMPCIIELAKAKRAYEKIRSAMEQVEATGYGIVMPSIDELSLEQPEIVRQGGRYGVRLEASAPSIHMMKAVIHTELSPIVGTEKQSEDLVQSLLKDFEDDPVRLWESNIFGKSLHELVNDGLQNKLLHMPQEARGRLQETLERVINEGCTGLICILI